MRVCVCNLSVYTQCCILMSMRLSLSQKAPCTTQKQLATGESLFSRCAIAMLAVVGLHNHHWKDLHVQAEGFVRRPQVLCHIFQRALKVTHSAAQRALMCGRGAGA